MTARVDPVIELYEIILKSPSVFGRIVQIAGLWNPAASRYELGLPERFRVPGVDQALAKWHQAFFLQWLSQSLTEKERDVAIYWAASGASSRA